MEYGMRNITDPALPKMLNEFLQYLSTIKGTSPNTVQGYKADLCLFFRFMELYRKSSLHSEKSVEFEQIPIHHITTSWLRAITLADLYAYISFVEKYRNNGNYAKARKVAALKSFFRYMHNKAKILEENPAVELESPKLQKRNPIYLTLEESKQLLDTIPFEEKNRQRDYCILTLFLNCGLRLSELCGINVSHIKEDTLTIVGKGNKERMIYLNKACLKSIENYLPIRNMQREKIPMEDQDALFISGKHRRIHQRTVERIVKKYIAKAGLDPEKYSPHKLRHTAATLMYKHGKVDIRSLQKILGHESIATTQIYTHVDDEGLREAFHANPLSGEK